MLVDGPCLLFVLADAALLRSTCLTLPACHHSPSFSSTLHAFQYSGEVATNYIDQINKT